MPTKMLKIEIISDVRGKVNYSVSNLIREQTICPFCWLGYKKLQVALGLAAQQGLQFDTSIKFEPFRLDSSLSERSVDRRTHYSRKFGPELPAVERAMQERGRPYGLTFSYDGKICQTTKSHRLLAEAYCIGGQKVQLALHELLFSGYFEEQADIGDDDFLSICAVQAGAFANVQEAKAFLASEAGVSDYWAGVRSAQKRGVHAVPYFFLNDRYAIPGAVEPEDFLRYIKRAISSN